MNDAEVRRGAGIYSKPVLSSYDLLVLKLSNSLAWRCPSSLMLDRYNQLMGKRHLDVGPGTGWYLAHVDRVEDGEITLLDLNENSLDHAQRLLEALPALSRPATSRVCANVLEPLPTDLGRFDSIAVNYLFHCVPGTWAEKGVAFGHLAEALTERGSSLRSHDPRRWSEAQHRRATADGGVQQGRCVPQRRG